MNDWLFWSKVTHLFFFWPKNKRKKPKCNKHPQTSHPPNKQTNKQTKPKQRNFCPSEPKQHRFWGESQRKVLSACFPQPSPCLPASSSGRLCWNLFAQLQMLPWKFQSPVTEREASEMGLPGPWWQREGARTRVRQSKSRKMSSALVLECSHKEHAVGWLFTWMTLGAFTLLRNPCWS